MLRIVDLDPRHALIVRTVVPHSPLHVRRHEHRTIPARASRRTQGDAPRLRDARHDSGRAMQAMHAEEALLRGYPHISRRVRVRRDLKWRGGRAERTTCAEGDAPVRGDVKRRSRRAIKDRVVLLVRRDDGT